jgi:membrane protein implicated in regulation of membrane protease activity
MLTGRSGWQTGAALLAIAAALAGTLGLLLGSRSWQTYAALFVGVILLFGWVDRVRERVRAHRVAAPRSRAQKKFKVISGGRGGNGIDRGDDPTNDQKYVM